MAQETLPLDVPFGLLELDADGTIIYYKPDHSIGQTVGQTEGDRGLVGRNLFADVMNEADGDGLRERLGEFWRGHDPTRSFDFTFHTERSSLPARVLLARTREQAAGVERESVFLYIRRA